jgi:hypothetical protein
MNQLLGNINILFIIIVIIVIIRKNQFKRIIIIKDELQI